MPNRTYSASHWLLFTLTMLLIAQTVTAQAVDRAQQLQEIVQLISRLKTTTDVNLYAALFKQLEEQELVFLSPTANDQAPYTDFLQQSDTGMIRLMPRESFDGVLYSSGGGAYYSFARLTHLLDIGENKLLSCYTVYPIG